MKARDGLEKNPITSHSLSGGNSAKLQRAPSSSPSPWPGAGTVSGKLPPSSSLLSGHKMKQESFLHSTIAYKVLKLADKNA